MMECSDASPTLLGDDARQFVLDELRVEAEFGGPLARELLTLTLGECFAFTRGGKSLPSDFRGGGSGVSRQLTLTYVIERFEVMTARRDSRGHPALVVENELSRASDPHKEWSVVVGDKHWYVAHDMEAVPPVFGWATGYPGISCLDYGPARRPGGESRQHTSREPLPHLRSCCS